MDAVHDRLICDEEVGFEEGRVGVEGGVVSEGEVTVMVALVLAVPPLPVQERV